MVCCVKVVNTSCRQGVSARRGLEPLGSALHLDEGWRQSSLPKRTTALCLVGRGAL